MTEFIIDKYILTFREKEYDVSPPFSVISALIGGNEIAHPYYSDNESFVRDLFYDDCRADAKFIADEKLLSKKHINIVFEGIDTISEIYLNGFCIGKTRNMHRRYSFDVKSVLAEGENFLQIKIFSPIKYAQQKQSKNRVYGFNEWMRGFAHIRKAHYSFGWDWGPQLPDMGIFRRTFILAYDDIIINDTNINQHHNKDFAVLQIQSDITAGIEYQYIVKLTDPQGKLIFDGAFSKPAAQITVTNPQLWWPNGYGSQPLYKLQIKAVCGGESDEKTYYIGLRTLKVCTEKDNIGRQFCFEVNGKKIFSMGGNYIPEDNILPNINKERTDNLLSDLKKANFNTVRVWGGGYYPDSSFYHQCDRLGLIVWQDFMFACTTIYADKDFKENIRQEFIQNIKRIRHHACLGLLCGNNEIEMLFADWHHYAKTGIHKRHYIAVFEKMLPEICKEYAPDIHYIPSSPTSGGGFKKPNDESTGDSHFWQVWHGLKPFEEYQNHKFRFCSEFGFESFPDIKTVKLFADSELNPFSDIMEKHQKCADGNARILYHISKNYLNPANFEDFIYISQILQNDAIKFNVEHLRRNRGVCMGALYWQINDCWTGISWSSIDYAGRWKALHYGAKRFFAPVIISLCQRENRAEIHICNEKLNSFNGKIEYCIASDGGVLYRGGKEISVKELSSQCMHTVDISQENIDKKRHFLAAAVYDENGGMVDLAVMLFVKPKHFNFNKPAFDVNCVSSGGRRFIEITTDVFVKYLHIYFKDYDFKLSDNYIDFTPLSLTAKVEVFDCNLSDKDLSGQICLKSLNDVHLNSLK